METSKIYPAMIAVMRDSEAVAKAQTNKKQGFRYRGIDDVYNSLHPIMAKHGVFMTTECLSVQEVERVSNAGGTLFYKRVTSKFTFWAEDGSSVSSIIEGEAMDSGDKAINKALSVAHKYCLFQAFCLPTEETPDPDSETHEVKPTKTMKDVLKNAVDRALIADYKSDISKWLAENIPDNNIDELTEGDCDNLYRKLFIDAKQFKKG